MSGFWTALGMVLIAAVTVGGDWLLKIASQQTSPIANRWFLAGVVIYAGCAFGWVFAMRHMSLTSIGVVYSLSTVLLLTALGVFVYGERLSWQEVAGIGCAIASLLLLSRFGS
jgi:small multidrug resistance pump